jgi:hypothetical protein
MAKCDACGNDYDKSFQVLTNGDTHTFDSFECAIQMLAPACGIAACASSAMAGKNGRMFCCDHCAEKAGVRNCALRLIR